MKIHARQIGRIPVSQIDGISIYNTEKFENIVNGQTEFTITVVDDHTTIGVCFLEINGVVYNEGEAFTRNGLTITWNNTFEIEDDMTVILKMGSLTEGGASQEGGLTELPESASFKTLKVEESMEVGKRGPVGPPNPNNLYVNGAIYAMPKDEAFTVTGPGTAGGNIFLQPGKAICSFTKDGPKTNPDGSKDSGIRTIGFVAQVTEEDKANNEDSVYIGTNVSRLYLYSRTAYPTIVSNRQVFRALDVPKTAEEGQTDEELVEEEPVGETVQTISPMATQEWTMELMEQLGVIGGQIDHTEYIQCPTNLVDAFDKTASLNFVHQSKRKHTWNLGSNGTLSVSGSNSYNYVPLFQENTWNEAYIDLSGISTSNISNLYFCTAYNSQYSYMVRFSRNTYSICTFSKYGQKGTEFNYALKLDLNELVQSGTVMRFRYDMDNESIVFSLIKSTGEEKSLLTIYKYAFSGLDRFDHSETKRSLGFGCQVKNGNSCLPRVVKRPDNYQPSLVDTINDYAVVRYRHVAEQIELAVDQQVQARIARAVEEQVQARIAQEVEKAVNAQMTSLLRMIKEEK